MNIGKRSGIALSGLLALAALPAQAADITLKIGGASPATHVLSVNSLQFFMHKVTELTNGKVEFTYFPSNQLGKGEMLLAQSGVLDVGEQPVADVADKLPLSGVVEMPGIFQTACEGEVGYRAMTQPGAPLYEEDFKPLHVRVIFTAVFPTFKLFTVDRQVKTMADFKGLKIRTTGGGTDITAASLGAVSVRMPSADAYQSLSRHTLDGVFFALLSATPYDVQTVTKYVATGVSFGASAATYVISDRKWASLPPDVQGAMNKAGQLAEQNWCSVADGLEAGSKDILAKAGITFNELAPDQKALLKTDLDAVSEKWAKALDDHGKKGTAALQGFRTALKKAE